MNRSKKPHQTRYLSQAAHLEEAINPSIIRSTMLSISIGILFFLVWAAFTNVNEVARTPGEIVTKGRQQVVQHLEGGIVNTIAVHEGQLVNKGDILITLDGAGVQDDLNRALARHVVLAMQEERLRAFVEKRDTDFSAFEETHSDMVADQQRSYQAMLDARGQERNIIAEQLTQKQRTLNTLNAEYKTALQNRDIAKELYGRRQELNKRGLSPDIVLLESQRNLNTINGDLNAIKTRIEVLNSEIIEYEQRLDSTNAHHRDQVHERLDQVLAESEQNTQIIEKLSNRVKRLQIRAPTTGYVKGLEVNTLGAVVLSGQTLMEIVPLGETLVAQVKIPPQHIGHIKLGQDVQVKLSSYDFSRYGSLTGKLDHISATTFENEVGERFFQGRILLDSAYVGSNPNNRIVPGMTVMADIITGEKTVLDYLLKPIKVSVRTAFNER